MAAPVLDPAVHRLKQATSTVSRAADIMRAALPADPLSITSTSSNTLAVPQHRGKLPLHLVPNSTPQPWELLPLKAAAFKQYPNFFNHSCTFFGSLDRDVRNSMPFTLLRPNKLAMDLSRVVTNLGITAALELVQKRNKLGRHAPLLPPTLQQTANRACDFDYDALSLRQYANVYIRLHLRRDMHRPIWEVAERQEALEARRIQELDASEDPEAMELQARLASQQQASTSAGAVHDGSPRPSCSHVHAALPLKVTNISRASRPVLMYPQQVVDRRQVLPSGIFFLYHHQLGIITDAQAEQYDLPALVLAHVGLPSSMVAQIRGALRDKASREQGVPLTEVAHLKDWSMARAIQASLEERSSALAGGMRARKEMHTIQRTVKDRMLQMQQEVSASDISAQLHEELLAWELVQSGALEAVPPSFLAPQTQGQGQGKAQGKQQQQQGGEGRSSGRQQGRS